MFNDDWDAAIPLYPIVDAAAAATTTTPISLKPQNQKQKRKFKPPITLLVISVGENIFFDPSSEELAVADAVVAISVGQVTDASPNNAKDVAVDAGKGEGLRLLAIRTIDPPSRQFAAATAATAAAVGTEGGEKGKGEDGEREEGVWRKRTGGMKRGLIGRIMKMILEGGVGADIFRGLENWT